MELVLSLFILVTWRQSALPLLRPSASPAKSELQVGIFLVWFGLAVPWEGRKGQASSINFRRKWVWVWLQSHCRQGWVAGPENWLLMAHVCPPGEPMLASPSPSSQRVLLPVGKQSHQWLTLHLLFLGETQSKEGVGGCNQISVKWGPFHALSYLQSRPLGDLPGAIPGAGALTTPEGGLFTLEIWPLLRSTVTPWACADLYCLSKARASIESNHLCTFLEALGYLKAVAEIPKSSPSKCHRVRRGSPCAKSQGSCLGYLWHGAREDWAGGTREYQLKSHKTFLVN